MVPSFRDPCFPVFTLGNTDSIVVRFHSWIFIQSKESSDANGELFKEDDDEAMYKNPYEIRLCDLISVSFSIKRTALHRKYLSFIHTYAQGAWGIRLHAIKEMRIVCQNVHGSHFCGQQGTGRIQKPPCRIKGRTVCKKIGVSGSTLWLPLP